MKTKKYTFTQQKRYNELLLKVREMRGSKMTRKELEKELILMSAIVKKYKL